MKAMYIDFSKGSLTPIESAVLAKLMEAKLSDDSSDIKLRKRDTYYISDGKHQLWVTLSHSIYKVQDPDPENEGKTNATFLYALHLIQQGKTPKNAKPLKGFKPNVMEIVTNYNTDTYRSIYSVKIDNLVYVLHCFQKKSKTGIKTPKNELKNATRVILL